MSSTSIYALLQHPNVKSSLAERYINFIESCTCDETEYHEDHHVLPSSIYPEYSNLKTYKWNCKPLSARQHFIAHCMLARMFQKNTPEFFSMVKAFNMMGAGHHSVRYTNSRLYEQNRKHMSTTMRKLQMGHKNSQHGTCWTTSPDLNIRKKIKIELINEYYEQGWFISRSKTPFKCTKHPIKSKSITDHKKKATRIVLKTVVRVLHLSLGIVLNINSAFLHDYLIDGFVLLHPSHHQIRMTRNNENITINKMYMDALILVGWTFGYVNKNHKGTTGTSWSMKNGRRLYAPSIQNRP